MASSTQVMNTPSDRRPLGVLNCNDKAHPQKPTVPEPKEESCGWGDVDQILDAVGFKAVHPTSLGPEERYKKVSLFEARPTRQLQNLLRDLATTIKSQQAEVERLKTVADRVTASDETVETLQSQVKSLQAQLDNEKLNSLAVQNAARAVEHDQMSELAQLQASFDALQKTHTKARQTHVLRKKQLEHLEAEVKQLKSAAADRTRKQLLLYERLTGSGPRHYLARDRRVLDVIDAYQTRIDFLTAEVAHAKSASPVPLGSDSTRSSPANTSADEHTSGCPGDAAARAQGPETGVTYPPMHRRLTEHKEKRRAAEQRVRVLEKELERANDKLEALEMDLSARPSISEWRQTRQRVATLERQLKQRSNDTTSSASTADPPTATCASAKDKDHYNLHLYKIDAMSAATAKQQLRAVCKTLRITASASGMEGAAEKIRQVLAAVPAMQRFIDAIKATVLGASPDSDEPLTWDVCQRLILERLKTQAELLASNSTVVDDLNTLTKATMVLLHATGACAVDPEWTIADLCTQLQQLGHTHRDLQIRVDVWTRAEQLLEMNATSATEPDQVETLYLSHVQLFQQLFDVPTLAGTAPAMTAVHNRLAEFCTALQAIGSALQQPLRLGTVLTALVLRRSEIEGGSAEREISSSCHTPSRLSWHCACASLISAQPVIFFCNVRHPCVFPGSSACTRRCGGQYMNCLVGNKCMNLYASACRGAPG
eukprot:m.44322 g.44322  ORF g.44322 m.44322 type:complete len:714 (-) comp15088_c0_seq1:386-2527(-)